MVKLSGGNRLDAALSAIGAKLGRAKSVEIGFLEGATYSDQSKHEVRADYSAKRKKGDMSAIKGAASGTPSVAMVAAINEYGRPEKGQPPRPFFRTMIAQKSPEWGAALKNLLKDNNYDAEKALALMGDGIKGQLQDSIVEFSSPALSPKTIKAKGFSSPLVDTGHMLASVDYAVKG